MYLDSTLARRKDTTICNRTVKIAKSLSVDVASQDARMENPNDPNTLNASYIGDKSC